MKIATYHLNDSLFTTFASYFLLVDKKIEITPYPIDIYKIAEM